MNATPSSPKGSYGPPTAASSSADSPNPQPHNAQDELSRQPLTPPGSKPGSERRTKRRLYGRSSDGAHTADVQDHPRLRRRGPCRRDRRRPPPWVLVVLG